VSTEAFDLSIDYFSEQIPLADSFSGLVEQAFVIEIECALLELIPIVLPSTLSPALTRKIAVEAVSEALDIVRAQLPVLSDESTLPTFIERLVFDLAFKRHGFNQLIFKTAFIKYRTFEERELQAYYEEVRALKGEVAEQTFSSLDSTLRNFA